MVVLQIGQLCIRMESIVKFRIYQQYGTSGESHCFANGKKYREMEEKILEPLEAFVEIKLDTEEPDWVVFEKVIDDSFLKMGAVDENKEYKVEVENPTGEFHYMCSDKLLRDAREVKKSLRAIF